MIKDEIVNCLAKILDIDTKDIVLDVPAQSEHGDYSSNIALTSASKSKLSGSPREIAEQIVNKLSGNPELVKLVEKIEVAGPGFINFFLSKQALLDILVDINTQKDIFGRSNHLEGKKIMVEYAHPNTHKELHIGHMRTLTVGESLARIFDYNGAEVFRANYQGDIGPHVAKSIWGVSKLIDQKNISWDEAEKLNVYERAHLLGQGYILGSRQYKDDPSSKIEIDGLNNKLYKKDSSVWQIYLKTREWSLSYYNTFYARFGTKFDKLYFESEVADLGKKIVTENIGKVFDESEGAVVFSGEKYGLHTRVFLTKDGNPTYEAKDMGLAPTQFADFPFDRVIHVVANEQEDYFKVIIKALELIDPKFVGRQYHLSMGMVNLVGKKISSRTGEIITVDDLLEKVKVEVKKLIKTNDLVSDDLEDVAEKASLAAVKYSVLRTGPKLNTSFDIEQSVNISGDSGPYLQYTAARCRSVVLKGNLKQDLVSEVQLDKNEANLVRMLTHFPEVVSSAATTLSPNLICNYLFDLASKYNNFYNQNRIIGSENEAIRLNITSAVGQVIKNGLSLLGIQSPERM